MGFNQIRIIGLLLIVLPMTIHARTLTIPGDADSVKEAVEMAVSGDEIRFETDAIRWIPATHPGGIRIENKNLVITGRPQRTPDPYLDMELVGAINDATHPSQYSLFWIENSHVTLRDVDLSKRIRQRDWGYGEPYDSCSPIQALSGSLTIQNCTIENPIRISTDFRMEDTRFVGNTFISNHPAGYGDRSSYEASLLIHSATGVRCEINRCVLGQAGEKSYKQMELSNLQSCEITIRDSTLVSGFFGRSYRLSDQYVPGAPGIHIHDCRNLQINLTGSEIRGGKGVKEIDRSHIAAPGGEGIKVERSTVRMQGGTVLGGEGERGYGRPEPDPTGQYRNYVYFSGKGGTGLSLVQSQVQYADLQLEGGPGGISTQLEWVFIPTGPPGEPLLMDETSTFQEMTSLLSWDLY